MTMKVVMLAIALATLSIGGLANAADAAAGQKKYVLCAGCHGPSGAGNDALKYPRLAGLQAGYVAEQLRAFKSGARDNATMRAMTAGLKDTDIDNLAAYVATLK